MKLQVAPYNNTAGTWTEAEETAFLRYEVLSHRFNNPAEVNIYLSDPTGVIARKYNVAADDVYVGPGKVTIEDPTGTDIFFGRIMKAEADTTARTVTLYCQDWLSQLDEEQITYDMREKLSGNIRQSTAHSDPDSGTYVGPAYTSGVAYYMYDDAMTWDVDEHQYDNLVFTDGMAGKIKVKTGPYTDTITWDGGTHTENGHFYNLWTDDVTQHTAWDDDADFRVDYSFRVYVGHNTPSDLYVHDSITGARIYWAGSPATATGAGRLYVEIWTGASYARIGELPNQASGIRRRETFEVPEDHVDDIVDSNGIVKVRFEVDHNGESTELSCTYLKVEVDVETTGYSTAIPIQGNTANRIYNITVDLTAQATRIWEGIPYCIAKEIYQHIDSVESPGTLITDGDTMVALTCAATIEHTSGVSTRQYVDKTRLEILKDLAIQDKAHFWIPLGQPEDTPTVTYKSTFNDGSPETLTDTDVNSWHSTFDYSTLANEVIAYGMRIGDQRLSSTYTDATSEAKYKQTRTKVTSDTGLVSEYDTLARATALVNQYKGVQQILTATIRDNTATTAHDKTLVLGDEVSITSTYLNLSAAVYIVQRWSYDSKSNLTTLLLHPRVSQTGLQKDERPSFEQVMQANRRGTADRYIAAPETNEVA